MIPVIVISLPRSAERRRRIDAHLSSLGVPFRFLDAVDGETLSAEALRAAAPAPYAGQHGRSLSRGEVACGLSHVEAARLAAADRDFTCVLEDDVELEPEALAFLDAARLRTLPAFDVLRLANSRRNPRLCVPVTTLAGREIVAPFMTGYNAWGQVYSQRGAEKIARHTLPLCAPFDNMIYRDGRIPNLRVLEVRPRVVRSSEEPTTIAKAPAQPTWRSNLNKRAFLLARYVRTLRNFIGAWGVAALFSLRRIDGGGGARRPNGGPETAA